jgi:acetyl/propionyl-CoA carboxylase alpha subunit
MEVRLYAEDPGQGFLPQSGKLVDWHIEPAEGLRVDSGVETGTEVSIHYDPMLAKLITHGDSREHAVQRMRRALTSLSVQGLRTNLDFLLQVLGQEAFLAGEIHTHFIERHMAAALGTVADEAFERSAAILAALADHERRDAERSLVPCLPSGWRNNFHTPQWVEYLVGDRLYRVEYRHLGAGRFELFEADGAREVRIVRWDAPNLTYIEDDRRRTARVLLEGDRSYVHVDGKSVALREQPRFPDASQSVPEGGCTAPMPGKVVELRVAEGDEVQVGEVLLVMEAMKMEHSVATATAGKVESVRVSVGEQVDADALLVVVRS